MFGAGGGTSSYREVEETDLVVLWGSNAREAHPIFFHHVLAALRKGAKLYVVDPRRTSSAAWADGWLGIDVGTDIVLANAVAREIIRSGLHNRDFIKHATVGFEAYAESVEPYTLEWAEARCGVPAALIVELAHAYACADRAELCWTLGITEHHSGVDNVLALINLALLCGHVGRWGSGINPLRGQNNVQGGGDMGALPNKLPGFQDVTDGELRGRFETAWQARVPPESGWHLALMFEAMARGELTSLYVVGENPVQSEADTGRAVSTLKGLDHLVVQDIFLTPTAAMADVVLPATVAAYEAEGTVTSSERRVQRVRRVMEPPEGARDDIWIVCELARRLGHDWGHPTAQEVWDELRSLSPMHAGMSYERLERLGGIQWPCYDEDHPGEVFLHSRLWADPLIGPRAPFSPVVAEAPVDPLTPDFPIRLTTGRHLDSYNTGVQSGGFASPMARGAWIALCREDAMQLGLVDGDAVQVISRRGRIETTVRYDRSLRPGLAFMTLHFQDEAATNVLTIDDWDPKSGTAEFKATAIRVEKIDRNIPSQSLPLPDEAFAPPPVRQQAPAGPEPASPAGRT